MTGTLPYWDTARVAAGAVAASIFVNPTQFGAEEDLARYPRDEDGDLAKLRDAGCDLCWLPTAGDVYPCEDATVIEPAGPALGWEGAARPGHFRGVATVVAKLFGHVRPDAAVFGEKDWQQLQVIARMTADLRLGVRVLASPIVREADGLAMSSRNRFLSAGERAIAPVLYRVLCEAAEAIGKGGAVRHTLDAARAELTSRGLGLDYLALVDGASLRETKQADHTARLIAAARLGTVRLLDNKAIK